MARDVPTLVRSMAHAPQRRDDELRSGSAAVHMYLERAGRAREHAHKAANEAERAFYERMEWSWMNLAAKTAWVEGVDLLLHARQHDRLPPLSQCPDCRSLMKVRVIKAERDRLVHNFECVSCGCREERSTTASSDDGFPVHPGAGRSGEL